MGQDINNYGIDLIIEIYPISYKYSSFTTRRDTGKIKWYTELKNSCWRKDKLNWSKHDLKVLTLGFVLW